MEKIPVYNYQSQFARELRDLAGVGRDLERTISFLEAYKAHKNDILIQDALYTASLVSYRRCFKGGMRNRISLEEIASLGDGTAEYHEYLIHSADKFAAHSVNAFEQIAIGVTLQGDKVGDVAAFQMRLVGPVEEEIDQWIGFMRLIMGHLVLPKIDLSSKAIAAEASNRNLADIMRAGRLRLTAPDPADAAVPRPV